MAAMREKARLGKLEYRKCVEPTAIASNAVTAGKTAQILQFHRGNNAGQPMTFFMGETARNEQARRLETSGNLLSCNTNLVRKIGQMTAEPKATKCGQTGKE